MSITQELKHEDFSRWFRAALFNLLAAAIIGALMRFAFVHELKWFNYKGFQGAHANFALLGWGYQALYAFLLGIYLPATTFSKKRYITLFWINQIVVISIALDSILLQDLIVSNVLMVLFSILTFTFIYWFMHDTRETYNKQASQYRFIQIGLVLLIISFAGVYIMVPSLLLSGQKKILLYYIGNQFFLHFQYNGWITFAVLALTFKFARKNNIPLDDTKTKYLARILLAGVLLTFFLSLYWGDQTKYSLLFIAALGGFIQLFAVIYYRKYLSGVIRGVIQKFDRPYRILFITACVCFTLKLFAQCAVVIPQVASLAFTIRNYVIAYIHLVFIGVLTMFLFAWAFQHKYITMGGIVKMAIYTAITAFALMETVLFIQGTMLWTGKGFLSNYYILIFCITVLIPISILIIAVRNVRRKRLEEENK